MMSVESAFSGAVLKVEGGPPDRIVAMETFRDRLIVATEKQIYELCDDGVFRPIPFIADQVNIKVDR